MAVRRIVSVLIILWSGLFSCMAAGNDAKWIRSTAPGADSEGSWTCFRQDVVLRGKPSGTVTARICADSKYWLWINGRLIVYEGNLKRGEAPGTSYYDEVNLAPGLKKGRNRIAVLVWHFGKSGFSHADSGKSGLFFDCPALGLVSDASWKACLHPAYGVCGEPYANFRLPEPNIRFNERVNIAGWQEYELDNPLFAPVEEAGLRDCEPWGRLVPRPVPLWKDFGVKPVGERRTERLGGGMVRITAALPYNMQMSPVLEVEDAAGGSLVRIETDHFQSGSEINSRAEYVTAAGTHRYESLGWLTAEKIVLTMPENVRLKGLWYRETGFDTEATGSFVCDDDFVNRFWKKALNTLYINMRDTFFDCPDRERAQWWGDITTMMGECFYTYDSNVHSLIRKAIRELCLWAHPDGRLHAPVPGNYTVELPDQMLASVGVYGFWNYYMNTGDSTTIGFAYPYVRKYLSTFSFGAADLIEMRYGEDVWNWGDWGDDADKVLILNAWYYLALESASRMAVLTGHQEDVAEYRRMSDRLRKGFEACWNGRFYRHPSHVGRTDDRVQALAVVSGIAGVEKYDAVFRTLREEENASPYIEKYVMEALFRMGHGDYAMERFRRRFSNMVEDPNHSTLFEGWDEGNIKYGGGTTNHAWSGGPLTVVASCLCGIRPTEPGFRKFEVCPSFGILKRWSISFDTVSGRISGECREDESGWEMKIDVPEGTEAVLCLPDGNVVIKGGACQSLGLNPETGRSEFLLGSGTFRVRFCAEAREVLDMRSFGIVPNSGTDIVPALRAVGDELKANPRPVELRFENGRYDIHAPETGSAFSYALTIDGIDDLSINGCGARFVCHGPMRVFTFNGCDGLRLSNMSFDWERPLVSQGTILGQGADFLDVRFDGSLYPYVIEDGKIFFYGDKWKSQVVPDSYSTLHEPDGHIVQGTKDMFLSADNSLFRGRVSEISPGVIRFCGKCDNPAPVGSDIVLYHGRYLGGVFTFLGCNGIEVSDVTVNHSSGMGLLAQMCSDISLRRFRVVPNRDAKRCFSSVADAVHLNLCRGRVLLSECEFDGQGDDALNVHGRYCRIDSVSDDRRSLTLGSKWGKPDGVVPAGDRIWCIDSSCMRRSGKLKVVGNEACADGSAVLRLKTPVPDGIGPGDFVENADRFPDVLVERCRFGGGNRARGILLTTPGRTVVRDNLFRSSGAAILIEGDTSYWFESGAVRDVEISGNVFDCCGTSARDSLSNWGWGEAPITISPSYSPKDSRSPAYHRGIKISNNRFRCFDNALLYARSVVGLRFVGNSVERISGYAPILKQRTPIRLDGCRHVRIRKNLGL